MRDALMISLSLIVFGVFMVFVIYLSQLGYTLQTQEQNRATFDQSLQTMQTLEFYDNTTVTRDDVLMAVQQFAETYNIYVLPQNATNLSSPNVLALTTSEPLSSWSVANVSTEMANTIDGPFLSSGLPVLYHASLIHDPYSGQVTGIEFQLENQ